MKMAKPKTLCALLLLVLFLAMFVLNLLTPLIADDFIYSLNDYAGNEKVSFASLMRTQYLYINGRVLPHALLAGALLLPRPIFACLNAVIYCFFIFLLTRHANTKSDPIYLLFCIILSWFFLPVFGETVLWTTGACNYLWGTVLILAFLHPYADALSGQVRSGKSLAIRCGLLGLLAGSTSENTAGAAILFCGIVLLISFLRSRGGRLTEFIGSTDDKQKRVPLWMITGTAGAFIGYCLMLTAPANFFRLDNVGSVSLSTRLQYLSNAASRLYQTPSVIYVCLLTLSIFFLKNQTLRKSLPSIVFAICGCAAGGAMLLSSSIPDRAFFGGLAFIIIAILYQAKVLLDAVSRTSLSLVPILCIATAAFTFSITLSAFQLRTIKHSIDGRDTYIREQIELGVRDVVTDRFYPSTQRSALTTLGDIPADQTTWKNRAIANYYRLNTIHSNQNRYLS